MTPSSSPATPDPAHEAMKAEWAEIKDYVMGTDGAEEDNDDPEVVERLLARSKRMREFLARHKEVLDRRGKRPEMTETDSIEEKERQLMEAAIKEAEAEDRLLDATAARADAERNVDIAMLEMLYGLENLPSEDWERMDPLQRSKTMDSLLELRTARDGLLAELPIDVRREWERKLGI